MFVFFCVCVHSRILFPCLRLYIVGHIIDVFFCPPRAHTHTHNEYKKDDEGKQQRSWRMNRKKTNRISVKLVFGIESYGSNKNEHMVMGSSLFLFLFLCVFFYFFLFTSNLSLSILQFSVIQHLVCTSIAVHTMFTRNCFSFWCNDVVVSCMCYSPFPSSFS